MSNSLLPGDVSTCPGGTGSVSGGGTPSAPVGSLQTNAGAGLFGAYAGSTCTNQFTRALSAAGVATCASVSLTADITGALAVANGGTGAVTLTGILLGNGTSAVTVITTSAGLAGAISDETGSGKLTFATAPTVITPWTFTASDGTTNFSMASTLTAVDYLEFSAGQTGIGGTVTVKSATDTSAPMTWTALGGGAVNVGNGNYATPILAIDDTQSGYPTYPTFVRFLNASSAISASVAVPATGSFVLRPDAGINSYGARAGSAAADLQIGTPFDDTAPYRIASGANSFAAGVSNIVSGNAASAPGGNFLTCTGANTFCAGGQSNLLSGVGSIGSGFNSTDFGVGKTRVHAGGDPVGSQGGAQYREQILYAVVTSTGANRLTVGNAAAAAGNVPFILNTNERSVVIKCDIIAGTTTTAGTNIQTWTFGPSVLRRPTAGVGSTALSSTTVTAGITVGTVGNIAVTAAADTTLGALDLEVTAADGLDWHVTAYCSGVDVK